MPPEHRRPQRVISTRWGTFGDYATGAFVVAAVSGVALAIPYDPADAYGSIASMLLANPGAAYFRNLHYWSGQACLVLTVLHVWDHLRAKTESRVGPSVWLRLALTLPLLAFLMVSGFMLRGDAEGGQAARIVAEATGQTPLIGSLLATLVFGAGERLDVLYVQHAATATMAVWLFVIEHARRVWPRVWATLVVLLLTGGVSTYVSPGLHDGLDPIVKGPWYFLGLQEILHWTSWPVIVVLGGIAIVVAIYLVRVVQPRQAARLKATLLGLLIVYGALCGVGALLRGENWAFGPTWRFGPANLRPGFVFAPVDPVPATLPLAAGRAEGCLVCHTNVTGLGDAHRPEAVGCVSCHGGDAFTLVAIRAHAGMELIPGNLATARLRCGQAACHPTIVPRVERSLMTTISGIVAVNRAVFGEPTGEATGEAPHVLRLGQSAADTHLRQLCAACHLGAPKLALGPNGEDARGGGCNACHLSYGPAALEALTQYERGKLRGAAEAPTVHPAVSLDTDNGQCFGCHSRSGRISTSYEGWHEMHEPPAGSSALGQLGPSRYRTLADERVFERVMPDVHQQRGLDCIDCHTANEVMGDGETHARKSQQLRVACEDCHPPPGTTLRWAAASEIDPESRKILSVRQWPGVVPRLFARTAGGELLVNVVTDDSGDPVMIRKRTGERRPLKAALAVCAEGQGHARLSCGSCHTAWAPRCPTCHTSFDAQDEAYDWVADADVVGAWKEQAGAYIADPPTLGVRALPSPSEGQREIVDTFVPGMVLTIERPQDVAGAQGPLFRRLYARIEPHTTRREARSCTSCHNDPVAIGYGRGDLRYDITKAGGRWQFTPEAAPLAGDGLPADAWIPFLGTRSGMVSTREDVRPFTVEEQRRILRVGACLTCHEGASRVMRESVRNFEAMVARRSRRCVLPGWATAPARDEP